MPWTAAATCMKCSAVLSSRHFCNSSCAKVGIMASFSFLVNFTRMASKPQCCLLPFTYMGSRVSQSCCRDKRLPGRRSALQQLVLAESFPAVCTHLHSPVRMHCLSINGHCYIGNYVYRRMLKCISVRDNTPSIRSDKFLYANLRRFGGGGKRISSSSSDLLILLVQSFKPELRVFGRIL